MEFSESFKLTSQSPLPAFSPDGQLVASATEGRCFVRDVQQLAVLHAFPCQDRVSAIQWSPCGRMLLCSVLTHNMVQIWSLDDEGWSCTIDEGPAGLSRALWSATGRHVLTVADFNLRMSVWDLASPEGQPKCQHIRGPKHSHRGIHFCPSGQRLAVAERKGQQDYLTVYRTGPAGNGALGPPARFPVATSDLEDLCWSPDGTCLLLWDSPLAYNALVYSHAGMRLCQLAPEGLLTGMCTAAWHPGGSLVALGGPDAVVRLLNAASWKELPPLGHTDEIKDETVFVFRETRAAADGDEDGEGGLAGGRDEQRSRAFRDDSRGGTWRYTVSYGPVQVPVCSAHASKPAIARGVVRACVSTSGAYLATATAAHRGTVWIWSLAELRLLCVLMHSSDVEDFAWHPRVDKLLMCCGRARVHVWTPDGAVCVHMPDRAIQINKVVWSPDGSAALCCDRTQFCVAYLS